MVHSLKLLSIFDIVSFPLELGQQKGFFKVQCVASADISFRLAAMGNQVPSADLVAKLPHEVLSVVLTFLTLSDVLRCLQVCKKWKENILNSNQYWINMLRTHLNISQSCHNKYSSLFLRSSNVFFEIKKHLVELEPAQFSCQAPVCYPAYSTASCIVLCRQGIVVRKGESGGMFVESFLIRGNVVYVQTLGSVDMDCSNSVAWAHFSRNRFLYWLDWSTKVGTCYDISSNRVLHNFDFLSDLPFVGTKLDSGVEEGGSCRATVACCKECSLGIVCYLSSTQSYLRNKADKGSRRMSEFSIRVFSLGGANRKSALLYCGQPTYNSDCRGHDKFTSTLCSTPLQIMSASKHRAKTDCCCVCSEHSVLLCERGNSVLLSISVPCNREGISPGRLLPSSVQTTAVCLSCKELSLIDGATPSETSAQEMKCFFLDWMVNKDGSRLGDSSNGIVPVDEGESLQLNSWRMVCIGQQLSIVGCCTELSSISEDKYFIAYTESGKLYKEIQPFPSKLTSIYEGSKVLGHFISQDTQLWLDDLRNTCPTVLMTVVLGDAMGKLQFLLVQRNQDTLGDGGREYAVNTCFVK